MEALTLLQTGKRNPIPVVLTDRPGDSYWSGWLDFMKDHLTSGGYIGQNDFAFFQQVHDVEDAVAAIKGFYRRYHSLRFVGGKTVVRMVSALQEPRVGELKLEFADLIAPGGDMVLSGALPKECDEPELGQLPRLVFDFNKKDFARLRQLIDAINSTGSARRDATLRAG
jgi:hypothetical protein